MSVPWPLISGGLIAGLVGGVHCAGMCGGIATALSSSPATVALGSRPLPRMHYRRNAVLSHAGRVGSYTLFGAAAGGLGSAAALLRGALPVQMGLYLVANVALALLGLYLTGALRALPGTRWLAASAGYLVYPLFSRLYPARSAGSAFALGAAWGCMPCGLVYGALALALVSGSPLFGAAVMLAFGLGTVPHLMLAGWVLGWTTRHVAARRLRQILGGVIFLMALAGLVRWASPDWAGSFRYLSMLCAI